jgi:hypothetical protein
MAQISAAVPVDLSTYGLAPAAQNSNIQLQQAEIGQMNQGNQLTAQQAQAAAMQNQILQARMPVIMQALQSFGNGGSGSGQPTTPGGIPEGATPQDVSTTGAGGGSSTDTTGGTSEDPTAPDFYDHAKMTQQLRNQYFVNSAGTPQDVQNIIQAGMSGDPGLLAAAKERKDNNVEQLRNKSQYDSSNLFDSMSAVVDADPDKAMYTLSGVAPKVAERIKTMYDDPEIQDAAARRYATDVAGQAHIYTGRKTVAATDGTYRDEITQQKVPGVEASGMTKDQWYEKAKYWTERIDVPLTNGQKANMERYKAPAPGLPNGYPSVRDAVMKTAQAAGVIGAQPTVAGSAPAQHAASIVASAVKDNPPQPTTVTPPPTPPPPPGAAQSIDTGAPSHTLAVALMDKEYRDDRASGTGGGPVRAGLTQAPGDAKQQEQYISQKGDAQEQLNEQANSSRAAIYNFTAAQKILGMPDGSHFNSLVGIPASIKSELATLGYDTDTADKRAEAAKYLTNAAVSGLKDTYGSKPGVFDVKINVEKMFPNIDTMGAGAAQKLIQSNLKRSVYLQTMAKYGSKYLEAGNRPKDLGNWQNQYFPMADSLLNENTGKSSGGTVRVQHPDGTVGTIPAANLDKAKAKGYKVVQ